MSYFAKVGKVTGLVPIQGADNIQLAIIYATPCVVSRAVQVGDLGILFPEGGQLAPWYLSLNNLYRESQKNADPDKKGYFEESGRIRAQPFRGAKSEGFFMPVTSLGGDTESLADGDELTEWGGVPLCWKYGIVSPRNRQPRHANVPGGRPKCAGFIEHVDTKQWRFNSSRVWDAIHSGYYPKVTITEKMHGTSGRYGNHRVIWDPVGAWWEAKIPERFGKLKKFGRRAISRFRFWPQREEYKIVVGTRRVVLLSEEKQGYHGSEQFRFDIRDKIGHLITPDMTVYGEIVGYHPESGKPFMPPANLDDLKDKTVRRAFTKNPVPFHYGPDDFNFYVYRITKNGTDLPWETVKSFCEFHRLLIVPELATCGPTDTGCDYTALQTLLEPENLADSVQSPFFPDVLREGVVVRLDWPDGRVEFLKEKTYAFKVCEGILKEKEEDLEDNS